MYQIPGKPENVSQDEYIDWYRKTAKPIEEATGSKLHGFDPNFSFRWEHSVFQLPTSFVIKLSKILKEKNKNE